MIVGELVARVRETLRDVDTDRYTDERIVAALNLGVLDMRRMRPDVFIGTYDKPTYQMSGLVDEVGIPEITIPPIIRYAVGWLEMADDEYSNDGRAAAMLTMFNTGLGIE